MYYSDKETDKSLAYLERRIKREYKKAWGDVSADAEAYFVRFQQRYLEQYAAYEAGEYTTEEFNKWFMSQVGRGEHWNKLKDEMAHRLVNADNVARSLINDSTPSIIALNYNYENYRISQAYDGISFNLWDEQTVKNLIENEKLQVPRTKLELTTDLSWNKKELQNTLFSGVLRGIPIDKIAQEFQKVSTMDFNSAIRSARTAYTGCQNAGRQESYRQASKMGIKFKKEWMSTLDANTRSSHQKLDGEVVDYNMEFSNGLLYPGDPKGRPEEVWNCRCTMRAFFENINQYRETYQQWQARMQDEQD